MNTCLVQNDRVHVLMLVALWVLFAFLGFGLGVEWKTRQSKKPKLSHKEHKLRRRREQFANELFNKLKKAARNHPWGSLDARKEIEGDPNSGIIWISVFDTKNQYSNPLPLEPNQVLAISISPDDEYRHLQDPFTLHRFAGHKSFNDDEDGRKELTDMALATAINFMGGGL